MYMISFCDLFYFFSFNSVVSRSHSEIRAIFLIFGANERTEKKIRRILCFFLYAHITLKNLEWSKFTNPHKHRNRRSLHIKFYEVKRKHWNSNAKECSIHTLSLSLSLKKNFGLSLTVILLSQWPYRLILFGFLLNGRQTNDIQAIFGKLNEIQKKTESKK